MIDKQQLLAIRPAFHFLATMMDYPSEELFSSSFLKEAETEYPNTKQKEAVLAILHEFQQTTIEDLRQTFVEHFELNKRLTLYLSYYRFEDSRERGGLLAEMKLLYEMFGTELQQPELTDYLPTILEFLFYSNWENDDRFQELSLIFSVLEDGTYKILQRNKAIEDLAYIKLIALIREELKTCILTEKGVSHQ
ncbi:Nitrate reductase-like protein narX [Listeria grayi]|uniref:Nitrate reductase, delta chain n=1 Tax=Listeria grayi FSL F6-1183 TaxID=1265827 RepID=A0A829R723_LISGR|nr:nitrate reductase molybdenum cofactor assembly chaperone [Listeria grayi]EUJ27982.1 nitrate reductase, delta chain [Listeria grayi FSL F6-1183]VEI30757.1 Nitrate reductase-like protein narX [Listeria grayi]